MPFVLVLAALMGAAGIMLAAAGAHGAPGAGLDSAAYLLLLHAVAVIAAVALTQQDLLWRPLAVAAFAGWILGANLFAGDIAFRAFAGHRLFAMAAPSGGIVLILGWIAFAAAALAALPRR